jgi:hypothetical protein|nr:MAG TPA: hypothetical protein [Caudoviricetes sp.]
MKKYTNNALYYISKYNTYALVFVILFFISKIIFKSLSVSFVVTSAVYFVLLKTNVVVIDSAWKKL